MLSWLTGIILCSFLGSSEPRKVYVAKQISWHLQTMWLNLLSWAHTESTLAENTLHFVVVVVVVVAVVHFLIYCVDQFAHCHHHLPQPHTFCPHVLLSHLLGLHTCLLHTCHYPQNDHWPAIPVENRLRGWLFNSDVFGALPKRIRDHTPYCYGLWPLHGHLQASASYTTIMQQGLCQLLVVVAWIGGILHATVQILLTVDLTFCGFKVIDHFTCDFFCVATCCSDTYRLGMVVAAHSMGMLSPIFFSCSSSPT